MTADQLLGGLLKVLSNRGFRTLSVRYDGIDTAFESVFRQLQRDALERDLNLRFRVVRGLHGEATVMREALATAAQRDLISLDNPEYLDVRLDERRLAGIELNAMPGGEELYESLADVFLSSYSEATASSVR